jgi:NADH dehydrogenase FAD-containing subunit
VYVYAEFPFFCSALGRFAPAASQMKNRMASSLKMGVKFDNSDRKLRVAIVGGGPSGSCAAEILAQVGLYRLHECCSPNA